MFKHYNHESEIQLVVQGFEQCTTAKEDFTHREHLTVATWYICNADSSEALNKMRAGLHRFLDHHGVGRAKYKEQLTVAWMELIERTIQQMNADQSLVNKTNEILDRLGDASLTKQSE